MSNGARPEAKGERTGSNGGDDRGADQAAGAREVDVVLEQVELAGAAGQSAGQLHVSVAKLSSRGYGAACALR